MSSVTSFSEAALTESRESSTDPTAFKRETLLTVGILFYVLMTLTFGVALPSGIFTPSVLIGASLGGAAGITFQDWFGTQVTPSTFALLGACCLVSWNSTIDSQSMCHIGGRNGTNQGAHAFHHCGRYCSIRGKLYL